MSNIFNTLIAVVNEVLYRCFWISRSMTEVVDQSFDPGNVDRNDWLLIKPGVLHYLSHWSLFILKSLSAELRKEGRVLMLSED